MGLHGSVKDGIITGFSVITDVGNPTDCNKDEARAWLESQGFTQEDIASVTTGPTEEAKEPEPKAFDQKAFDEKEEDENCDCLSDNEVKKTKRNGQKVIVYTDANGDEHEYPAAYGTACIGWDELLPPYCGDGSRPKEDQPSWCSQQWCYIDPKKCYKKDTQRSLFFGEDYELFFSYSQCGAENLIAFGNDLEGDGEDAPAEESTATEDTESGAINMVLTTAALVASSMLFF